MGCALDFIIGRLYIIRMGGGVKRIMGCALQLKKALEEVLDPTKCGCKVTYDGEQERVYVHDLYKWTDQHMNVLLFLCPGARMNVQGSSHSLSGFMLTFQMEPKCVHRFYALRFGVLVLGCIAYAIYSRALSI